MRGFLLYECGTWPFIDVDIEYPQELKVGEDAKVYLDIDAGISHCEEDENTINLVTEHSSLERDLAIKLKSAAFDVSQVERIANAGTSFPLEFEWAIAPRRNRRGVLELDFSQLQGVISLEENAVRGLTLNRDSSELEVFEATLEVEVYTDIPIKESTVDLITLAFIALGTVLNSPLLLDIYRRRSSRASPESG
ncbi:MAG: hypothetical protein OXM03_08870 [Chloroflexota bacterium]|nr:hypothetical protein [Chloroflexota bacterium]